MNRGRLLVMAAPAAVAATLAAAPAAQAAEDGSSVVFERVDATPSPQSASEYWTPERMAAAQPLDLIVTDDGTPSPVSVPDTIANRVSRPYTSGAKRQSGVAFFKVPGGPDARCSGTAVESINGSVVWTAGHCVYHVPAAKFMKNWVFVPGYGSSNSDFTPFGRWRADALGVTNQWVNAGNPKFDLGAAAVVPKGGDTLQERVGGRELAFNYATTPSILVQAVGYPSLPPFGGNHQYSCRAPLRVGDPLLGTGGPEPLKLRCDMTGGSSGGGWRPTEGPLDNDVISVVSYGYSTKPNKRFGPYQGTAAQNLFDCAQGITVC